MENPNSHFALVLPGAVARGAYEAGVIAELAERDIKIDRIVATSSGALNGLAYAAGLRAGKAKEMAAHLTEWWIENGGWQNTFAFNPWSMLTGRGMSDQSGILKLMRETVHPCQHSEKKDVEFHVVITPLNGVVGNIGNRPATTYEKVIPFRGEDFDTDEGLEQIFKVVSAACSFPGLFRPVDLGELGACVDGGTVNNTPIKEALSQSGVSQVIVAVPFPEIMSPGDWKKGLSLLNHLIEILINERLYRDLKDAARIDEQASQLKAAVAKGELTEDQSALIRKMFAIQKIDITEIRPAKALSGGTFSGFFSKADRKRLVEDGRAAACAVLDAEHMRKKCGRLQSS